ARVATTTDDVAAGVAGPTFADALASAVDGGAASAGRWSCGRDTLTVIRGNDAIHAWRHTRARPAPAPSRTRSANRKDCDRAGARRRERARARRAERSDLPRAAVRA